MEKQETNSREYYTLDLTQLMKVLWSKAWIIALAGLVAAVIAFSIAVFGIAPTYSSSIMLYVNNSAFSLGNTSFSISSSEISAAQSLVKTYSEILNNRTTLERVIDKTGVSYTYKELSEMITAEPSNDTEIMRVTVVAEDPYEAEKIANCIAEVLPTRIAEIIDGASMEVVDDAVAELEKVGPSVTLYTALGLIIGVVLAVGVLAVMSVLDDTIRDEEYIIQTYDYPILAKIPNLMEVGNKRYGYYYRYSGENRSKRKAGEK